MLVLQMAIAAVLREFSWCFKIVSVLPGRDNGLPKHQLRICLQGEPTFFGRAIPLTIACITNLSTSRILQQIATHCFPVSPGFVAITPASPLHYRNGCHAFAASTVLARD